jgi:electron transfer flavoprotein alpha subunit
VSGVLVLAEIAHGEGAQLGLRPSSIELIDAGRVLAEQGAGALSVALIGHTAEQHADAVDLPGVAEIVTVSTPYERFEAHVAQAALERLIDERGPAVVLAGHTIDSLAFVAAVAAAARHGFASDVTWVGWGEHGVLARRPAYGERLLAELEFPGKRTVLLQLRAGTLVAAERSSRAGAVRSATEAAARTSAVDAAAQAGAGAERSRLDMDLDGMARSELVDSHEAPGGGADIAKADFLLSIGRGVGSAEAVPRLGRLAERMGATLSVSGPLVEAGWAPRGLKVGQSGRTVAPRVYLALGISGAAQHLAGMSGSRTVIAVNSDPGARIFDVADYGAVADLFEVADELERQLG